MNVKLRVLTIGVLFFAGQTVMAQKAKAKRDTTTKVKDIEEVVILGYGRKESSTEKVGNYAVVGKEKLENAHFTTVDNALTGSVAGVATNMTSGQPGANVNILIRGVGSLTQETNPLIIVDGIPQFSGDVSSVVATTNALSGINSNDIEELVVLKDAAATSIYGSRGANGVILIKTKSGKKGKPKYNFNSSVGISDESFNKLSLLKNAQEHIDLYALGLLNAGSVANLADGRTKAALDLKWDGITNTDWKKAVTKKNPVQSTYNFQVTAGNDLSTVFASLSYDDYQGIARDAKLQRLTAVVNLTYKLSDRVNLRAGFTGGRVNTEGPIDNNFTANPIKGAYQISPTQKIYNIDGDPNSGFNNDLVYFTAGSTFNSAAIQKFNKNQNIQGRITGYLEGNIKILKDLSFNSNISGYLLNSKDNAYSNPLFGDGATAIPVNTGQDPSVPGNNVTEDFVGRSTNVQWLLSNWTFTNFLGYSKNFGENHSLRLDVGMEATKIEREYTYLFGVGYDQDLANLGFTSIYNSQAYQKYGYSLSFQYKDAASLVGYIGSLNYVYAKKYSLNATYRQDKSSRFAVDKKGDFYSVGGSWSIDKENFLQNSKINELKLRFTYGTQGREANDFYNGFGLTNASTYGGTIGTTPIAADPQITWERQNQFNAGLDFGLFNNKISGSVDLFDKRGEKLLINSYFSSTTIGNTGSSGNTVLTNAGKLSNRGIEANLNFSPIKTPNFQWDIQTNFTVIQSKITQLPAGDQPFSETAGDIPPKQFSLDHNPSEWFMYLYAGVDPTNGNQLWYTDASKSVATADVTKAAPQFTGKNSLPTRTAGITNTFKYKGFTLSTLFSYMGDYSVYDLAAYSQNNGGVRPNINNYSSELYDSWTPSNPNGSNPKYVNNNPQGRVDSSRYLFDADHIRLKNIEFGYLVKKDVMKIEGIDSIYIYLQGQNAYTWAFNKKLYFDPESSSNALGTALAGAGLYNLTAPIMKTFIIGFKVNF
jgi:TonB-linked SusC/RagA family outer membrane protein